MKRQSHTESQSAAVGRTPEKCSDNEQKEQSLCCVHANKFDVMHIKYVILQKYPSFMS